MSEWTDADVTPVADELHRLGLCDDTSELDVPPCWTRARALLASGVVVPARVVEATEQVMEHNRKAAERAEVELSRLRSAVEALADEWQAVYDRWANVGPDAPQVAIHRAHANRLRALLTEGRDRAGEGAGS